MFTVLCRHVHYDWQSTEAFIYVIGKSNNLLIWKYIGVLNITGIHNFKHFYYIHIVEVPTQKGEKREYSRNTDLTFKMLLPASFNVNVKFNLDKSLVYGTCFSVYNSLNTRLHAYSDDIGGLASLCIFSILLFKTIILILVKCWSIRLYGWLCEFVIANQRSVNYLKFGVNQIVANRLV